MEFIDRLNELISKNKISKNKLLKDLGLAKGSISNWETRGSVPSADTIQRIADYFRVSTDYLLKGENPQTGVDAEPSVTFDDFTYAMYNEGKALSERDKKTLIDMARLMREREIKEGRRKPDDK